MKFELKKIKAFVFDAVVSFFVFGFIIALVTGSATLNTTNPGFSVEGWYVTLDIFLVFIYFFVFNRYLGGTLGKRLFRVR